MPRVRNSVASRRRRKKVLKQAAKDGVVLEMGCGTAQLFPEIIKGGAKKYIGVEADKSAFV